MQESKEISWAKDLSDDAVTEAADAVAGRAANDANAHLLEADGWQQYRKWISSAPAPRKRRSGLDPNLYTWKGYRTWTEQIKRNWSDGK